ncbi:MAG: hypothetical protein I8H68_08810 [Flavobacteriia bacterium]|nr:hypothetical protein [Flavobacteriia bacterium]MBH2023163.1 hypothetical protein [Flavobacteriales bacterium]
MVHRLILTSFGILTLATCQNPKVSQSTTEQETVKTETSANSKEPKILDVTTNQTAGDAKAKANGEPEMSVGLPPDKEAVETAKKEQQNSTVKSTAGVVYLKEGENKFLKEYEMNVTFKKMSEDSRCPKDVNCIWSGVATAEVEFMGLYTRPVILKLSTLSDAKKGYSKSQEFNGYTISLVEVSPETTSAKAFKALQGSYRIGLQFSKGSTGGGTTTR